MNPIVKLILDKGVDIVESQVPKILDIAKSTGIDMVKGQLPDNCKLMSELEKILDEAVKFSGPVLVEVNVHSVGEMPRYFAPPPHATKS